MCQYCASEGCSHGQEEGHRCSCDVTIGISSCPVCGCDCEPWWNGLDVPIGQYNLLKGPINDLLSDSYSDKGSNFFPATKEKIMRSLYEAYGLRSGSDEARWFDLNLPDGTIGLDGLVQALINHGDPIRRDETEKGLVWKYPASKLVLGQKIEVGPGEEVMIVARGVEICDSFGEGSYRLSSENCKLLASKSRGLAPGLPGVLDGFPVFLRTSMEFEVSLSVMGQTKALRKITARGTARFRVSSPKIFLEHIASKANYASDGAISQLKKRQEDLLKKEISVRELEELKNNGPLLEKVVTEDSKTIGLDCINVKFDWIGDIGPGMFASGAMPQMFDPAKIAQMKQFAESMRAAQMAGRAPLPDQRQTQASASGQNSQATQTCASCGSQNPGGSKFCNDCGKPLSQKRVCPKCGTQSDPAIKFCGNCGTKLS